MIGQGDFIHYFQNSLVVTVASLLIQGLNLGLDFEGGVASYLYSYVDNTASVTPSGYQPLNGREKGIGSKLIP